MYNIFNNIILFLSYLMIKVDTSESYLHMKAFILTLVMDQAWVISHPNLSAGMWRVGSFVLGYVIVYFMGYGLRFILPYPERSVNNIEIQIKRPNANPEKILGGTLVIISIFMYLVPVFVKVEQNVNPVINILIGLFGIGFYFLGNKMVNLIYLLFRNLIIKLVGKSK